MAITIFQSSSRLNLANSDILFELSSSVNGNPLFQYDNFVYDSGSTLLTTIKQQPNPSGYGLFNMGRILPQVLDYDHSAVKANTGSAYLLFQKNQLTAKIFRMVFKEEYASSISSSVVTVQTPIYSGSTPYYYFLNGTLDPNSGGWNWDSSDKYKPQTTPSSATFNYQVGLTDSNRTVYCQPTDLFTVSMLNGNISGSTTTAQDIYAINLSVYNNGINTYNNTIFNISPNNTWYEGGPRANSSQLWSAINQNPLGSAVSRQSEQTLLIHTKVGPLDFSNAGYFNFTTQPWDYYTVDWVGQVSSNIPNSSGVWDQFTIYNQQKACGYDTTRLIWSNNYGCWDFFNFRLANQKTTSVERGIYKNGFVNYSVSQTTLPYDITHNGDTQYFVSPDEEFTITSDWLTQEQADWMETLFYSPRTFIQQGQNTIPIILTNTSFISKTNPRTQKVFNYTISYKLSNPKRVR
jgi:hypothetical protein